MIYTFVGRFGFALRLCSPAHSVPLIPGWTLITVVIPVRDVTVTVGAIPIAATAGLTV